MAATDLREGQACVRLDPTRNELGRERTLSNEENMSVSNCLVFSSPCGDAGLYSQHQRLEVCVRPHRDLPQNKTLEKQAMVTLFCFHPDSK